MEAIKNYLKKISKIPGLVIDDITEKNLLTQSAALSYYCALSLAPFIILTLALFSFLGPETEQAFAQQVKETVGSSASEIILVIIQTAKENKEVRGLSGILSIIILLVSASAVFSQLKETIVAIFSEKDPCEIEIKKSGWKEFLKERIFSIGMMVSFIFISLISLVVSSTLPLILSSKTGMIWQIFNFILSLGIYSSVFFLVFYFVSNKSVKMNYAIVGGVVAALFFVLGRSLISVYLTKSAVGSSYGAAGSLIALLIWVYYSSLVVFISGSITKNLKQINLSKSN